MYLMMYHNGFRKALWSGQVLVAHSKRHTFFRF